MGQASKLSLLGVLALFLTNVSVAGAAATDTAASTWVDARLGDSVADVRARLGDPLRRVLVDGVYTSRYAIAGMTAFAVLYEKADRVIAILVFARSSDGPPPTITDPFHVPLGSDYASVKQTRGTPARNGTALPNYVASYDNPDGTRSLYEFASEKAVSIELSMTPEAIAKLSTTAEFTEHSGDYIAQAIVDAQPSTMIATAWEYLYLAYHPCASDTVWKLAAQTLQSEHGRYYDILDVTCPANDAHRTFFFDITAGYGKL